MGTYALRRIQVGLESVKGTTVTTKNILSGIDGQIEDTSDLNVNPLEYYTGYLPGSTVGTVTFNTDLWECSFSGDATPENMVYILNAGWKSVTATTASSGSTWVFPAPTTAINSPGTITVETGDNTEQLKGGYGIIPEFELKLTANTDAQISGKIMGRTVTSTTAGFDASTQLPATALPSNGFKIYYDAATGTIGTTTLAATMREASIKVKSGLHLKQFLDGVLYPTSDGQDRPEVTLETVLEYNTNAVTIRSDYRAKLQKRIRLISGTATTALNAVTVDLAGYWSKIAVLSEKDGNSTIAATFMCVPAGTTTADYCNFQIVNALTGASSVL